jgi:hypothetical protein
MRIEKAGGRVLAVAIGCLALLVPAGARATGVGLEVGIAGSFLGGNDFDPLDDAARFEVLGSVMVPSSWEVGIGTNVASHDVDGSANGSADITNVFGEARYRFGLPARATPHLHPFVAGRVGYSRLASDANFADTSRNGFLVGGGGGVEYWFTNKVAAVGSGMLNYVRFGKGDGSASESLSGTLTDIRAGLKVRF